ncbi:MAG: 2-hydroxyacyl-CoA dehydratase [Acidimicrobiales bacterium]
MAEPAHLPRRHELEVTGEILAHQRAWLSGVRERVVSGEPFAVLSADAPHEIYRALDIPYVVLQWWTSLLASRQRAAAALDALRAAGFPDDRDQYNALAFGELLAADPEPPWGGLPVPSILQAPVTGDGTRKLFEAWAAAAGAVFLPVEHAIDVRLDLPRRWWEELPEHWDRHLPVERIDLMTDQLHALVKRLEAMTGRTFSMDRFAEVMALANEHATWNRRSRDLVADAVPAPVSAAETMTATMIPQWHRGSPWGRDAARSLYTELEARRDAGVAVCPDERLRLMWLGRGLWSSLGLYREFEEDHGAVFVWSMYLALAADAYYRRLEGADPMRALASRFVPMGEEIRMPSWSAPWHLNEARRHRIDGVVSFGEDDYFSARLLREAGIPVLSIEATNVDGRTWDPGSFRAMLAEFLEHEVRPAAAERGP